MSDPFSNEALRGTLNTQAEIYANIRNKALDEAAALCFQWRGHLAEDCAVMIRALKTEEK